MGLACQQTHGVLSGMEISAAFFWKANLSKLKSVYALAQSPHLRRYSHMPVWTLKCVYCGFFFSKSRAKTHVLVPENWINKW